VPPKNQITPQIRSDLIDWLDSESLHWSGLLDEDDFLARLYDLRALPSTDTRRSQYPTAAEDIHQHRVRNADWDADWVFQDPRFNLRHCPDEAFLNFLELTVQPSVRRDPQVAKRMVGAFNGALRPLGLEIAESRRVGESVHYSTRRVGGHHSPLQVAVVTPDLRDSGVLAEQLQRLQRDLDADPAAAIAHCKELLESQCKLILDGAGVPFRDRDDLPALYAATSRALAIHHEAVVGDTRASEAVRGAMRSLQSLVQNVAEARNSMGTGHGRKVRSPAGRRHARLVFNATVAISEFLADSWSSRADAEVAQL
jgi:hypothetical protein